MSETFEEIRIVGMHFREREGVPAREIVASLLPGDTLRLEREPDNEHDQNAIKAFHSVYHIGYVQGSDAVWIAPRMDEPGSSTLCTVRDFVAVRKNVHPICDVVVEFPSESPA